MARIRDSQLLVSSVLDRLIDDDPDVSTETPKSRSHVLRELRLSVQRDLENLLNTRWRSDGWPEELKELDQSLTAYGIPDFTGAAMSSFDDRQRLKGLIEQAIKKFEPRFKEFRVEMIKNSDASDRTIRFRIDALLYAHPSPEPVVFDSWLEPATKQFGIKQGRI